ncbi:MAG: ECF transporter S component [Clostridia bacterium]|nr:ECF transporter S component [Clostridia bacterium]
MTRNKANDVLKLVLAALFAALICVATMVVRIPMPATDGYANLGDAIII